MFAKLIRPAPRRDALRALAALLGGMAMPLLPTKAGRNHRNHRNPRKRLRQQCQKLCKRVQHDCLANCRNLGYPDDICHPQCSTARHSCRQGCS